MPAFAVPSPLVGEKDSPVRDNGFDRSVWRAVPVVAVVLEVAVER